MHDIDLILHIGAGKTGSSAIQTFLRQNHRALAEFGFAVPDVELKFTRRIGGHHVFALQQFFNAKGKELYHRLNHMMASRPQPMVILSAENLSNPGNFKYFKRICAEYRTAVIFYIRRQDEYFASAWQQWYSKIRGDLDGWLADAMKTSGHWHEIICAWESVADRVIPRVFERRRLPDGDVVRDFVAALGLPDDEQFVYPGRDVNPSYSNVITSIFAGRRDLFENIHDNRLYDYIHSLTGDKYVGSGDLSLLTRQQREFIVEQFQAENEQVRSRYFPDLESLFSPLDHAKYTYANETDISAEQIRLLTDIVSAGFGQSIGGRNHS